MTSFSAWLCLHPGTGHPDLFSTFEAAMDSHFEGFNLPREVTITFNDTVEEAYARVKSHINDPIASIPRRAVGKPLLPTAQG